jgi:[histone H3]-lysine4 N-trimethyltransferase SETD1
VCGVALQFRLDEDSIVDATLRGNVARYINHSCDPNCIARVVSVDGHKKVIICSSRAIERGQEITYDYKFASETDAIKCNCGAPNCAGRLN